MHLNSDICTSTLTFGQTPQKWPTLALKIGNKRSKKERHSPNPYWYGLFEEEKRDQNCSNLASVAPFTFDSSLYGFATLYPEEGYPQRDGEGAEEEEGLVLEYSSGWIAACSLKK